MSNTVAYGVTCTWWEDKEKVGLSPEGLPCCPHCKGALYEMSQAEWDHGIAMHTAASPGYTEFMAWARGQCFADYATAQKAYKP